MKRQQQGMGMLSFVMLAGIAVVVGTSAVRLTPLYIDYWSLSSVIKDVVEEQNGSETSPAQVRSALQRRFITNRIEAVSLRDITIKNNDKGILIDASYEKRVPLMMNIDAVVKFEEAQFQVLR